MYINQFNDKINWFFVGCYITITFLQKYIDLFWYVTLFWQEVFFFSFSREKIIAFDFRLSINVKIIATNGRVIFATVELNEGYGYDPSTRIFIARAAGVYVLDWTTFTQQGKIAYTSLLMVKESHGKIVMMLCRRHFCRVANWLL